LSASKNQGPNHAALEKNLRLFTTNVVRPIQELYDGAKAGTLPWHWCFCVAVTLQISVSLHWDFVLFRKLRFEILYPLHRVPFLGYYLFLVLSPFWSWALSKTLLKQRFLKRLTYVFQSIGLKNGLGKLPGFIFDKPLDAQTRKLRLSRVGISPEEFFKRREDIASALHVYMDEVRENRAHGTIDFIYGLEPMPREFRPESYCSVGSNKFLVGTTRSKQYVADLRDTPHLLVAGQTGGGKSTFLRQFITSLYLNNPGCQFSLIDLKGGLEFSLFERLPRVSVIGSVAGSVFLLKNTAAEIETRMKLLKANRCKDLAQFIELPKEKRIFPPEISSGCRLGRQMIVVDEAAEMFLAGAHASSSDVQTSRRILSQVARQGRSLGIHLVIATQRPDSRALDPQIKANLTGVLCFKMVNDVSSISVLGTGRATDLPSIPGRGIWKSELEMVEVQTPFLTMEGAEALLQSHYLKEEDSKQHSVEDKQAAGAEATRKHERFGKE
jgi:ABC-type ATPase involved in cell division